MRVNLVKLKLGGWGTIAMVERTPSLSPLMMPSNSINRSTVAKLDTQHHTAHNPFCSSLSGLLEGTSVGEVRPMLSMSSRYLLTGAFFFVFILLIFAADKLWKLSEKKDNRPLGVLTSILIGGVSIGLGYFLVFVGLPYSYGSEHYHGIFPVTGWTGILCGGIVIVGGVVRTLRKPKGDLSLEELGKKLKKKSSSAEDKEPRS
jgi:hypothetical protein